MRARNIKPGFFRNEQLADCSYAARLLFPGLWMLADREGRLEYRPKRWKGELFPYDNIDMDPLFAELEAVGLVRKYEVDGVFYVWIPTFLAHQNPHCREPESVIPPHPEDKIQDEHKAHIDSELCSTDASTVPAQCQPDASTVPALCQSDASIVPARLNPESSSSKSINTLTTFEYLSPPPGADPPPAISGQGALLAPLTKTALPQAPACPYEAIVGLYHEILPEHPRVKLVDKKRRGNMKARWGDVGTRLRTERQRDGPQERLAYFRRFFGQVARSDFLTGKKAFRDGTVYIADFDKLLSPNGFKGVIEGRYDNRQEAY